MDNESNPHLYRLVYVTTPPFNGQWARLTHVLKVCGPVGNWAGVGDDGVTYCNVYKPYLDERDVLDSDALTVILSRRILQGHFDHINVGDVEKFLRLHNFHSARTSSFFSLCPDQVYEDELPQYVTHAVGSKRRPPGSKATYPRGRHGVKRYYDAPKSGDQQNPTARNIRKMAKYEFEVEKRFGCSNRPPCQYISEFRSLPHRNWLSRIVPLFSAAFCLVDPSDSIPSNRLPMCNALATPCSTWLSIWLLMHRRKLAYVRWLMNLLSREEIIIPLPWRDVLPYPIVLPHATLIGIGEEQIVSEVLEVDNNDQESPEDRLHPPSSDEECSSSDLLRDSVPDGRTKPIPDCDLLQWWRRRWKTIREWPLTILVIAG